jgi:TrmH family RNA methyltransferase
VLITSRDNERLRTLRKLRDRRWRDKLGLFAVEGEDLLEAGLAAGLEPADRLVAGEDVAPELLAEVSVLAHPARVIAVYRRADLPAPEYRPVRLALWRVADPGNLGTIIRTLDAFGGALYLSDGCADPTGPKAVRASAGAIFRVPIGRFEDAPRPWVVLDPHVRMDPPIPTFPREVTFVLGAEREGVPREVREGAEVVWSIPADAESLNVAVAGSIALWEWRRSNL